MAAGYWSNRLGPRSSIEEAVLYGLTLGRIPPTHEDHCRIEQVDNKSLGHLSALGPMREVWIHGEAFAASRLS
jgi:hypothetical protein